MTITSKTQTVVFIDTVADRLDGQTLGFQKAGNMPDQMMMMIELVLLEKSTPVLKNEVGDSRSTRFQRSIAHEKDGDKCDIGGQFTVINPAQTIGKPSSMGMDDGIPAEPGGVGADVPAWLAGNERSG
ncbi:hypothetical protein, partial [Microcoleus sp. Pol12B5]|uniref:hypothetical protein n=1 Tax=Microcoleus sp. Pol12B5 TaxID=3055396 RepID=UPI002FD376E5